MYYYAGSQRVAMRTGTAAPKWILTDHLGSTSVVTAFDGTTPVYQRYKPFGETRLESPLGTKYTFTGQLSHTDDFGLLFFNARWVDPQLARFAQADTLVPDAYNPQDYDRYAYTRNNPLRYVDPSGHRCFETGGQEICSMDNDSNGFWTPSFGAAITNQLPYADNDPYQLTENGEAQYNLLTIFIESKNAWWQRFIIAGVDPLLLLLAIIFSAEASPLWLNPEWSGWGIGGVNGSIDPSGPFLHTIASRYFLWGSDPRGQGGQGKPDALYKNALLNFVGAFSETARKMSLSVDVGIDIENLMPKHKFNSEFISLIAEMLPTMPYQKWLDDGMWDWGNTEHGGYIYRYPMNPINVGTVFYIYPP